jgi:dienelactone hydrolase
MVLLKEPLEYRDGEVLCEGHIALNTLSRAKRPCVLIAHAWDGPNEQIRAKASNLARMGYLGFALDVYGKGVRGGPSDDNTQLMALYIGDRTLLRRHLLAALAAAKLHPFTDPSRIAVIGYCFGGLCALDLARAAPPELRVAVSVHGMLRAPEFAWSMGTSWETTGQRNVADFPPRWGIECNPKFNRMILVRGQS